MWSWMGVGALGTKFGLAPMGGANPSSNGANLPGGWNYLSSLHTGGVVQFAMGDGSVRGVRVGATGVRNPTSGPNVATSDWYLLQAMSGMQDGDVISEGRLTN